MESHQLLQQALRDGPTVSLLPHLSDFISFLLLLPIPPPSHTASWLFLDQARPPLTSGPLHLLCSLPIMTSHRYTQLTPWLSFRSFSTFISPSEEFSGHGL